MNGNESGNAGVRKVDTGAVFWGLALVGIGTLFLLERLDLPGFHDVISKYWPLFIVFLGVSKLFRRERIWGGLWLIVVGVWLQLSVLHVYGLTFHSSWPLLLIAMGAGMVLRSFLDPSYARRHRREGERHD